MNQSNLLPDEKRTEYPFPIRVLTAASPVMFVMLPLLWLTGYPAVEWPFVCGVFALSLIGSGTLTGYSALIATKWLYGYARTVATKLGIDLAQPENETESSPLRRAIFALVVMSLLAMASWGLALFVLGFVMERMGMVPIGTHFSLIAVTLLLIGGTGFALIIGGLAAFFYAVDRHPRDVQRFSRALRNWINIAGEMGQRWRVPGAPTLTGRLS